MALKLKYETGIATSIQFIVVTFFNIINGIASSINQCTNGNNDCVGNIVLSLLYFLVISIWFGGLWLAGFAAQDRRSKRISQILIAGELMVLLVSLFDLTHHNPSAMGKITSFVDAILAFWVTLLAFRLMTAKGGRVRPRNRKRPIKPEA